jgi:hypothetical protein
MAGAVLWLIGDWLAFGQEKYHGRDGYKRIENGIYAITAEETGFAEGTLRNAKYVCAAVNLSLRRDKLTFAHAQEIVGQTESGQFDYWSARVAHDGLTVKQLREQLRRSRSVHKDEPNDHGIVSPLAITDQYIRDLMPMVDDFTPAQAREHLANLRPLLERISQRCKIAA